MVRLAVVVALVATVAACKTRDRHSDAGTLPSRAPETAAESPRPSPIPPGKSPPPPGFVDLSDVDSTILLDIRYYTDHNFVGRRIDGYAAPRCLVTAQAAQALHGAQRSANAQGLSLKMYDCYRPLRAGEDFKRWGASLNESEMKAEFFPSLSKSDVFRGGYVAGNRSPHSRGSTVDLTLVALPPKPQRPFVKGEALVACTAAVSERFPDNTLDMGSGYDCFDTRSHTTDPRVTGPAKQNRLTLRQLMTAAGFRNNPSEWWHYSLIADPFPSTYFDFPINP
ncbi:MAG TPA: M15 family metallopeptidase [Candidatus Limnocylindrales bacterium]|nr:M15 family metallopeptidase [Candidatus Limnocylindrales bacterium]